MTGATRSSRTIAWCFRIHDLNESVVAGFALEWFGALGHAIESWPKIAPAEAHSERGSFADAELIGPLHEAITRLELP